MELSDDPITIDELFKQVRSDEILADLKELGVDLRDQAFKNPTQDEAFGLYSLAIQVIFGKTIADIRPEELYSKLNLTYSATEGTEVSDENLDLLKRGIGNLRLWRYCQKLHDTLGLPRIERYELFNPTPDSFHRLISAFVVYLRFREALNSLFEANISNLDTIAERETHLDEDLKLVEQEFENFKKLKAESEFEYETLLGEKENLEQILLRAKSSFNEYKEQKCEIDAELERLKLAINDIMLRKTKARHTLDDISTQIILDPDAVYKHKSELEAHILSQEESLRSLNDRLEELKVQHTELEHCRSFLNEVKVELQQHLESTLKPHIENISTIKYLQSQNNALKERIRLQKDKRDVAKDNLNEVQQRKQEKMRIAEENAQKKLQSARQFAKDSEKEIQKLKENIREGELSTKALEEESKSRKRNALQIFSELNEKFRKVTGASESYYDDMNGALKYLTDTLSRS